jgi:hypothetical protein
MFYENCTPFDHHWEFDNGSGWVVVPGATGTTYDIGSAVLAEGGLYRCIATGDYTIRIESDAAVVTVAEHLHCPWELESDTVTYGKAYTFSANVAGGLGVLHYQWYFDNGTKAAQAVGGDSATLTIAHATDSDTGQYWVTVSDDFENITSNQATLTVIPSNLPAMSLMGVLLSALAIAFVYRRTARRKV